MIYRARGRLIQLTQEELNKAKEVGEGRNSANANSQDKPYYDRDKMQDDATASFAAAAAECAVAKVFGEKWHAKVWPASEHRLHADEPDVGKDIEVKRIREKGSGLVIRKKDVTLKRRVVLAYPIPESEFGVVDVIGWISAKDGWEIGMDSGRGYKRAAQEHLHEVPGAKS